MGAITRYKIYYAQMYQNEADNIEYFPLKWYEKRNTKRHLFKIYLFCAKNEIRMYTLKTIRKSHNSQKTYS